MAELLSEGRGDDNIREAIMAIAKTWEGTAGAADADEYFGISLNDGSTQTVAERLEVKVASTATQTERRVVQSAGAAQQVEALEHEAQVAARFPARVVRRRRPIDGARAQRRPPTRTERGEGAVRQGVRLLVLIPRGPL